jgi:putative transposase
MSRFSKLSQTVWHCQYHIVFCPKYRYRVLEEVSKKKLKSVYKYSPQVKNVNW